MKKVCLYQGVLNSCQSYHGNYAYHGDSVVVSDGDGTTFSTRVHAVRCAWVPVVVSCRASH
jgi:hypothetical protein